MNRLVAALAQGSVGPLAVVDPDSAHPILAGLQGAWPLLLGANEVTAKTRADVEVLARLPESHGGHPLLVAGSHGQGRTVAWMSDLSPHWLPASFSDWQGYTILWRNILTWLTKG